MDYNEIFLLNMALIECKNCGQSISDKATLCPHCKGVEIAKEWSMRKKILITIIVCIVGGTIGIGVAKIENYFNPSATQVKEDIVGTWTVADKGSLNWCQITFHSDNTYSMRIAQPSFGEWSDTELKGKYIVSTARYNDTGEEYINVSATIDSSSLYFSLMDYNQKKFYWGDEYWGIAKKGNINPWR